MLESEKRIQAIRLPVEMCLGSYVFCNNHSQILIKIYLKYDLFLVCCFNSLKTNSTGLRMFSLLGSLYVLKFLHPRLTILRILTKMIFSIMIVTLLLGLFWCFNILNPNSFSSFSFFIILQW